MMIREILLKFIFPIVTVAVLSSLIVTASAHANEEIPVCDCPGLEDLGHHVQDILQFMSSADPAVSSDHELLTSIDELTLVTDMTFNQEASIACYHTNRLIDREPLNAELLEQITSAHPSVIINGTIHLGEFDPSFLRLTQDGNRLLILRGEVGSERRYFVLLVDENGIAQINVFESLEGVIPARTIPSIESLTPAPSSPRIDLTPSMLSEEQPGHEPESTEQPDPELESAGPPGPSEGPVLSYAGTNTGFTFGAIGQTDGGVRYNWGNRFSVMGGASPDEYVDRDVERISLGSTLDLEHEPGLIYDYTLRTRGTFDASIVDQGETTLDSGSLNFGVTVPHGSREFTGDLTFDLHQDPTLRLAYSNFGANQQPLNQAREALRITPPRLTFGGRIGETAGGGAAAGGDSGKDGGPAQAQDPAVTPVAAAESPEDVTDPDDILYSFEGIADPEGVQRLQMTVVDLRGERARSLDAAYDARAQELTATGAISLPDDRLLSMAARISEARGNDVTLLFQRVNVETTPDGATTEHRFTPQLFLSDQEFTPSRLGFDYVRVHREEDPEGLDRRIATHFGATLHADERVELRLGSETEERTPDPRDPNGTPAQIRRTGYMGTATLNNEDYEVFVVARDMYFDRFSDGEGLGVEAYLAEHAGETTAQMSVEAILIRDGGERSYSCSLGIRYQEGQQTRGPPPVAPMHTGTRENFSCDLLLTQSATGGLSQSVGVTYTRRLQNGGEIYAQVRGDTSPQARDRFQFQLGTQVRR
jgi:hypothetical protein